MQIQHNSSAQPYNTLLYRYYWLIVTVFATVQTAMAMVVDFRRKLWVDELYTLFVANQRNIRELLQAGMEGCDGGAPPLYAIIVHTLLPIIPTVEFAIRLPATIGYAAMILLIAAFFRRVLPPVYALSAVFLMYLFTFNYACEGRAYGLALGFAGCALYCWRNITENRPSVRFRVLFVFSAAVMAALHFYTVLFFVPLFIADLHRVHKKEPLNMKVWIAAAAAMVFVLALLIPFISTSRQFMEHFWAPALWGQLPDALFLNLTGKYVYALAAVLLAVAVYRNRLKFAAPAGLLPDDYVWTAFLLYYLSPMVLFPLSVYTTHVYVNRYTMWMLIGAAGFIVALFALATRQGGRTGVALAGFLFCVSLGTALTKAVEKPELMESKDAMNQAMALPNDSTPIVIADHHAFMELYHYAPQKVRDRLVHPLSRAMEIRYAGYDTGALLMDAIRKRGRMPVVDYKDMLVRYRRFYLVASPPHYLPALLLRDGYKVQAMQVDSFSTLSLVE